MDNYVSSKWEHELTLHIKPYILEKLGSSTDIQIYFNDRNNGQKSYKDADASPTIRIVVPREKEATDEVIFEEMTTFLRNDIPLQYNSVFVEYIAENGVILEDNPLIKEW